MMQEKSNPCLYVFILLLVSINLLDLFCGLHLITVKRAKKKKTLFACIVILVLITEPLTPSLPSAFSCHLVSHFIHVISALNPNICQFPCLNNCCTYPVQAEQENETMSAAKTILILYFLLLYTLSVLQPEHHTFVCQLVLNISLAAVCGQCFDAKILLYQHQFLLLCPSEQAPSGLVGSMRICQTPCRGNQLQQAMLVIMGSGVVKINNGYGPCRCSSLGTQLIGCKHLVITKTRNTARRCRALPIGPVEFGVCLSEEVQHMKACSIDSEEILVHVQALQLLICINRNSQFKTFVSKYY